ncbi:hypothetical protein ACYX79_00640 [Stenotrophomonas rhizophila]
MPYKNNPRDEGNETLDRLLVQTRDAPQSIPHFSPADPGRFALQSPQFNDFLNWDEGSLWRLINSEAAYLQMAAFSLRGSPAVAGITQHLDLILQPIDTQAQTDPQAEQLGHRARRAIGSMIRAVLEVNGFRKTGILRAVAPEPRRLFVRSEVYERVPVGEGTEAMEPNWDQFALGSSFATVRKLASRMSIRALPSMYSPDKRWFYLSSLDIAVRTTDEEELRLYEADLKSGYNSIKANNSGSLLRLATYYGDYLEVCTMLYELSTDPDEFADPDLRLTD